ncbi:hypothetical protein GWC77_27815 [Paraburkholderia sp. NMBU_R16]|nr:hypothetical protein [Paraburkholderia sp. NMBU_R16]
MLLNKAVGNGQLGFDQKHRLLTQNPAGLRDAGFVRASASTKVGEPLFRGRDIWSVFAGDFRCSRVQLHRNVAAKRACYETTKCTI